MNAARPVAWLKRMESEHANLRTALNWSLDEPDGRDTAELELGLRLAVALWWFWHTRDYLTEGRRYLQRAGSKMSNPTSTRLRARALDGAAWLALYQGDHVSSKVLIEEALALYRRLQDEEGIASGLTDLGFVVLGKWDDIPLPGVLEELGELNPRLKNRTRSPHLLMLEGMIAMSRSDLEHSITLAEQSLAVSRDTKYTGNNHVPGPPWPPGVDPGRLRECPYTAAGKPAPGVGARLQTEHPTLPPHSGVRDRLPGAAGPSRQAVGDRGRHGGDLRRAPHPRNPLPHRLRAPPEHGALAAGRRGVRGGVGEGKAMPLEKAVEYALSDEEEQKPPTPVHRARAAPTASTNERKAHPPRARSRAPRRAGANQPPDRLGALGLHERRQQPRGKDLAQACSPFPSPDRRLGNRTALLPRSGSVPASPPKGHSGASQFFSAKRLRQ